MDAHPDTDAEIALLGVLATGFESRQQQTNGLHIGEDAGRRAHRESIELQRQAQEDAAPAPRARLSD